MKSRHESRVRSLVRTPSFPIASQQAADLARQVAEEATDFAIIVALPRELEALLRYFPELERADQQVQGHGFISDFDLRHAALTRFEQLGELDLGQVCFLFRNSRTASLSFSLSSA